MTVWEIVFGVGITLFGTGLAFTLETRPKKDRKWIGWVLICFGLLGVGLAFIKHPDKPVAAQSAPQAQQSPIQSPAQTQPQPPEAQEKKKLTPKPPSQDNSVHINQKSSGDCSPNIVGGGPNTVNCAPRSRVLDDEHENKFKAPVAGLVGVHVYPRGTDQDVVPLATQLCRLLPKAECPGIDGSLEKLDDEVQTKVVGIHCFSTGDEIKKAFEDSGLTCVYESGPFTRTQPGGGTVTLGGPTIVIGNRGK